MPRGTTRTGPRSARSTGAIVKGYPSLTKGTKTEATKKPNRHSSTTIPRTASSTRSRRSILCLVSGDSNPGSKGSGKRSHVKPPRVQETAPSATDTANTKRTLPASQSPIRLKVVVQKVPQRGFDALDNLTEKSDSMTSNSHALRTSFMARDKSKDDQSSANADEAGAIEMDFLDVINISATANFCNTWTDVYFGEGKKSAAFQLVLDTGSSLTWINKSVYIDKCSERHSTLGKRLHIWLPLMYVGMPGPVFGELYENTVTFGTEDAIIEKQRFLLIDETSQPIVRTWRMSGTIGILGLELASNMSGAHGITSTSETSGPSVTYNLLRNKVPAAHIIGLDINIPSESSDSATSGHEIALGEVHFGGFKRSAFNPNVIKWITIARSPAHLLTKPQDRSQWRSKNQFSLDMNISFDGEIFPDPGSYCSATIDTGSPFIYVPRDMIQQYIQKIGKGRGMFHYDSTFKLHFISKNDFGKLRDVVFKFDGADIVLPPHAQVIPASIMKQWISKRVDSTKYLYLNFLSLPPSPDSSKPLVILGLCWICRYYLILNVAESKVGIAEVGRKINYVWKELRELGLVGSS